MTSLDRITVDPRICSGQPTIRGMRITVSIVLKQLASGMSWKEIMVAYPELEHKDIEQTVQYAAWLASEKTRPLPMKHG